MKWVGMPISARVGHQIFGDAIGQHAFARDNRTLGGVRFEGIVLEILHKGSGFRPIEQVFPFSLINTAAACGVHAHDIAITGVLNNGMLRIIAA